MPGGNVGTCWLKRVRFASTPKSTVGNKSACESFTCARADSTRAIAAAKSRLLASASSTSLSSVGSLNVVHQLVSGGALSTVAGRSSFGGAVGVVAQPKSAMASAATTRYRILVIAYTSRHDVRRMARRVLHGRYVRVLLRVMDLREQFVARTFFSQLAIFQDAEEQRDEENRQK